MKTTFTSFVLGLTFCLFNFTASSQLNYLPAGFTATLGTYTDLGTNGDTIVVSNYDDAFSSPLPIGFTFNFNGAPYDSFVFSTNGFIKLGSIVPSRHFLFTTFAQPPQNGPFTSTTSPTPLATDSSFLFAFGQDLVADTNIASMPRYQYYTDGTIGSRVCTIQWRNVKDKLQNATVGLYDSINFQIKLYEGSNIVEFVYGTWSTSIVASAVRFSAVGIVGRSFTTLNQNLHLVKGSTVGWGSSTAVTGFYANNAVNYRNPISSPAGPAPGSGRTFTFVPLVLNDAAVNVIYAQGKIAKPSYPPTSISANVSNPGVNTLTNIDVTLNITGANTFSALVTIPSLAPGANTTVSFPAYAPIDTGASVISVSVPNDDNNLNNQKLYSMSVNNHTHAYFDTLLPVSGSNGITIPNFWGCKYFISGNAVLRGIRSFLVINSDATGDTVCGMVLDTLGNVLARSPNYIVQASDLGTTLSFTFPIPQYIQNKSIIAGIAGGTSINGLNYFLGSSQTEVPIRNPNPFYFLTQSFNTGITNVKQGDFWATPGIFGNQTTRLMMEAIVTEIPANDVHVQLARPVANLKVPTGTPIPITAILKNLGSATQAAGINVFYRINNGTPIGPIATTANIASQDTASVVFAGINGAVFATPGTYTLKIYTQLAGDEIPGNDTFSLTLVATTPQTLPYTIENMDILVNWTVQNVFPFYLTTQLAARPTGGPSGGVLWADNITYPGREGRIYSPAFNFTGVNNPVLHFHVAHAPSTFVLNDSLQVQVSTDGGYTFTTLYTKSSYSTAERLGTAPPNFGSWTPLNKNLWRYESVDLSGFANAPFVIISFRFTSEGGNGVFISHIQLKNASGYFATPVFATGTYTYSNVSTNFTATGAASGEVEFTKFSSSPLTTASPVFETNGSSTTNNGSIFTPNIANPTEWYSITYSGIGTGNPDTTVPYIITYDLTGLPGIPKQDSVYIMIRENHAASWKAQTSTLSGNALSTGLLTGFYDIALGSISSANPLPVSWLSFNGYALDAYRNQLSWSTASEVNTAVFVIERSTDMNGYTPVQEVKAAGQSNSVKKYEAIDVLANPAAKRLYYRIKQVDKDGAYSYSKVIQIAAPTSKMEWRIQNPFSNYPDILLSTSVAAENTYTIEIANVSGNKLSSTTRTISPGTTQISVTDFMALPAGMYFVTLLQNGTQLGVQKVVKN